MSESIEWFIEDQVLKWSYDSAPHPPPSPSLLAAGVSVSLSSCVSTCPTYWWEMGGGGHGAKSYDREEAWSSKSFNTLWSTTVRTIWDIPKIMFISAQSQWDTVLCHHVRTLTFFASFTVILDLLSNEYKAHLWRKINSSLLNEKEKGKNPFISFSPQGEKWSNNLFC